MKKLFSLIRKPIVFIPGIIVIVVLGIILSSGNGGPALQTAIVTRGTVTQEVSVTGTVKPVESVELSFEKSGRIARVLAKIGDTVTAGAILAELDRTELLAQLAEADAQVKSQQAKLDELRLGTRPEEIDVKRTELKSALQALGNDYAAVPDAVNDAYAKADDAIRSKTNQLFTNEENGAPRLTFLVDGAAAESNAQTSRQQARLELTAWQAELPGISNAGASPAVDDLIIKAKQHLSVIRDSLARALDAVNRAVGVTAATLDTYRTNIGTARTNVIAGLTGVSDAEQAIAAQKLVLQRVQNELNLALAGATTEQIQAQEAAVEQVAANAQALRAQLAKTRIVTPFTGIVTAQDAKVGEIAGVNAPLVKVISGKAFQIEANVPEADIAKIAVGNAARITLDAYGADVPFEAQVMTIDPAEKVIEGVSTYKMTLEFKAEDQRIKSGMTANIDVVTGRHENVLFLPQWAVTGSGNERTVQVQNGETLTTAPVTVGLRGFDGSIEILTGVKEGDTVVVEGTAK